MKICYLVRLDDACPFMNSEKWKRMEQILDQNNIKPLVGIIPNNEDSQTIYQSENINFWNDVNVWLIKGWDIALHGYNHVCSSNDGGINPVHNRSEFAGIDYQLQIEKITNGLAIFLSNKIEPKYFFAPSHTFDLNTLQALKNATSIRIVSDTLALKPYIYMDMIFIPQQMGKFRKILIPGYWTFCFHPNIMSDKEFEEFEQFIKENKSRFISFKDISFDLIKRKGIIDKCLSAIYFSKRAIAKR